jgi:hypothetical protein
MITPFSSFLNYLKSMRENNVYLANSLSVLNIKKDGFFKGKITITDMALNEYDSIPFDFKINAKIERKIPIFSLFKWESGGD